MFTGGGKNALSIKNWEREGKGKREREREHITIVKGEREKSGKEKSNSYKPIYYVHRGWGKCTHKQK